MRAVVVIDSCPIASVLKCLQMARFSHACHAQHRRAWPKPEDFGLDEAWVSTREDRAVAELEAFSTAKDGKSSA